MKKYILILTLIVNIIYGQDLTESYLYQSMNTVKAGIFYQSVKVGETKINQIAFPLSLTIPLAANFTASIVNNPAFSKNDNSNINGLTETKIGLRYYTLDDKLLIKVITGLPTGKTDYSIDQFNLAKLLSTNTLDYYVSYYGRGFNSNLGLSYAQPVTKSMVLGAGISYYYKGTFHPLDLSTGGEYNPGDEITLNIGMDYAFDKRTHLNFDVIYTKYGMDQIDGNDKFQAAPRVTFYSGFQFKIDRTTHNIFILDRLKGENKLYIQKEEFLTLSGNQLNIGYNGVFPLNLNLSLLANLEGKFYGDIQQMIVGDLFETGKTDIYNAGIGLRIFLSELLTLDVSGNYKTGKINIIKGNIATENNVSGYSGLAVLYVRF